MSSLRLSPLLPLLLAVGCINTPPPSDRALHNNEICTQELAKQNCPQAKIYCDLGLEFAPQYADLWTNEGLISLCLGNKKQAKENFIKAIRFNQEQASAYLNLGKLYLDEDDYRKAEDSFLRALKVNPDYVEARYNLALCYMDMKKPDQAKKEFLTLLAVDPNNAQIHHDLGVLYYQQDSKGEAEEEMLKAVQLAPALNPDWWNDLGAVEMDLSRFPEAVQAFGSCVALKNDHPQCQGNLAIAQRKSELTKAGLREGNTPRGAKGDKAASRQQSDSDN